MRVHCLCLLCLGLVASTSVAGPYNESGLTASAVPFWADGFVDGSYMPARGVSAPHNAPVAALGPADGLTVSLGELDQAALDAGIAAGSIVVSFNRPVYNGPGWDLAVFENGFRFFPPDERFVFAELAFVEVSSNGIDFVRFPSISLTTERFEPFGGAFAGIDPSDVFNLAGKHGAEGTSFDLEDLVADPMALDGVVDLQAIRFVRLIDIPGSASLNQPLVDAMGAPAFTDSEGRLVLDAWDTGIDGFRTPPVAINAGFDLDAVGARYVVPEASTWGLAASGAIISMLALRPCFASRRSTQCQAKR